MAGLARYELALQDIEPSREPSPHAHSAALAVDVCIDVERREVVNGYPGRMLPEPSALTNAAECRAAQERESVSGTHDRP
jgi:hypothetical protein